MSWNGRRVWQVWVEKSDETDVEDLGHGDTLVLRDNLKAALPVEYQLGYEGEAVLVKEFEADSYEEAAQHWNDMRGYGPYLGACYHPRHPVFHWQSVETGKWHEQREGVVWQINPINDDNICQACLDREVDNEG